MIRRELHIVWILIAALLVGCSASDVETGPRPVLLIGVDGMEWDVVLPLLGEGRLPNLERLMERGAFGEFATTKPTKSPILWTSMVTGQSGDKHGITDFLTGPAKEPGTRLFNNRDRRSRAVWNILSDRDMRVAVVGWWMTYPVEEVNGVMVAQVNTSPSEEDYKGWKGALFEEIEGQVHPPERQAEILAVVPEVENDLPRVTREIFSEVPQNPQGGLRAQWESCEWALRADEIYRRTALKLMEDDPAYDLFAVYLSGTDVVGHRFWRFMRPDEFLHRPTDEELRVLGNVIVDYYVHIDRVIGELIDAAPPHANVIVVSDHGMSAVHTRQEFPEGLPLRRLRTGGHHLAPPGVIVAAGPDIRRTEGAEPLDRLTRQSLPSLGSVLDVAPTLLALLDAPAGRDMDGAVMESVIDPGFLERHPVRFVDSHTPPGWFEARSSETVDDVGTEERLEQLRALGYIGGGGDD